MQGLRLVLFNFIFLLTSNGYTATPLWTFSSPSPAVVSVGAGEVATAEYTVTNQSNKPKHLFLVAQPGLSASNCALTNKGSTCRLTISINGNLIPAAGINTGPVLCDQLNPNQCYQPALTNQLNIKRTSNVPTSKVTINVNPTSLTFFAGTPSSPATLTNQSLNIDLKNLQILLPAGLTLDPGSTCTPGGNLPAASSCTLIFTAMTELGTVNVAIQGDNSNSLNLPINVNSIPRRVAVGRSSSNTLISYYSLDAGQSWMASTVQPQGSGQLSSVSCNSTGLNCVAAGGVSNNAVSFRTADGGKTWSTSSMSDVPPGTTASAFNKVFCDANTGLQCVAVGTYQLGSTLPLVNISSNGGQTWSLANTRPSFNSALLALSCDSTASRCTSGGSAGMFYSLNGGVDWNTANSFPATAIVRDIQCDSAIPMNCTAVGQTAASAAFASYTSDNGDTWIQSTINPALALVRLSSVSCSTNLSKCIAMQGATFSLVINILKSTDQGQVWNQIGTMPVAVSSIFNDVFCDGNGQNCTAVGGIGAGVSAGVTYYSLDGETNWTASNLPAGSTVLIGVSGQR
ncbi:WD40/YVTN/BNR-like repeat-containing protein [Legionella quateirensis]|uniref:Transmembrane protein (Fibronectin III domain and Gp5 C-terminal repeat) n=1 Tax=Legionella quateirensis TaxID=45072 RepID=A0A378KU55_9GAMM|nr:hypothetical protein [Legionella quateirensis]KTD43236.1 hypothetical protein Lqua_3137 [Legionella quateirensis]STY18115.1 transmembrane protein (fibronectin III domain and Gp5 C-terminal repeat) [Legionella quateirensis]